MTSNFLAEVIQARDATTGDEFQEMLQNVDHKLAQIKTELVDSLKVSFVLSEADIDRVTCWYVEILSIHDKVQELQRQFHEDRKALQSATENMEDLSEQLESCDRNSQLLKALVDVVRNIEKADPADFYKASKRVKTAQEDYKWILDSFNTSADHDWMVGIRSNIADLFTDIYEKVSTELWTVFHFGKNSLTINTQTCDIKQLIESLLNIGYCSRFVNKLATNLWQDLLSKACSQDYLIRMSGVSKPNEINQPIRPFDDMDGDSIPVRDIDPQFPQQSAQAQEMPISVGNLVAMKAIKIDKPTNQVEVVFNQITEIIAVFNEIFTGSPEVMEDFSQILGPRICEELSSKCLKTLILRNAEGDIARAKNNISLMRSFVENLSSNFNFEFPQGTIFDELEQDFGTLFLAQVRQDLLVKIRTLIKANLHDTEEIAFNTSNSSIPEEVAALHRNPYLFPRCVVSKSVAGIVQVLKDHLRRYPDDIAMCDAAFNLYISLMKVPKHESEAGDLVPFSAVLIHNNSHFLAHHACFTFPMCEDKVPELRAKATQAYAFMMRSVRTKLNSMISEAMAGIIGDDAAEAEIAKFLKISNEFVRLDGVFKHVIPSFALATTLATLVDHTVNEMCSKVLSWDDISANSANQLASAFTQFAVETSELFKGDATNSREVEALTAKCVTKWNRFRLLTFVLTSSMKEIEDKWVEGCGPLAVEFRAEEIRKLVRALFQNTDRRAAFLSSIK